MAQQTVDPNADERYAPVHDNMSDFENALHGSDAATSGSSILKDKEEQAAEEQRRYDREFHDLTSDENYNENGTNPKDQPATQGELADSENKAADDTVGNGYTGSKGAEGGATTTQSKKGMKGLFKNLATKKALIAGVAGGGAGAIGILVMLLLLASSLGIPNLAQNITNYELARMSRQASASIMRTTDEAAAIETTNDSAYSRLKEKYTNTVKPVKDTWAKLDKYRPQKVISNMEGSKDLVFNYGKSDILGRPVLTSVTLKGETYEIAQQGRSRFVPGLSSLIKFRDNVNYSTDFAPALRTALRSDDIGPIVRGSIAKELRQRLGISLFAWVLSSFKGKSGDNAQVEETQQRVKKVDEAAQRAPNNATTSNLKEGIDDAKDAEKNAARSNVETKAAIKAGGIVQSVQKVLANSVKVTGLDKALSFLNPASAIAMSVCIVYDGSLEQSGPTIDQQATQQQAAYYYIASAADQQKYGAKDNNPETATELASAINATNASLNSTTDNNAEIRASGYSPDTSKTLSAEQSAGGQYTLLDATLGSLGVPGAATTAKVINKIANRICPVATNTTVIIGGAIVNLGVAIASLGGSEAAAEAAGTASEEVIGRTGASLAENLVTKYIGKTAGRVTSILYDTGKGTVKGGIKIAAATVLAKLLVNARAGQVFSGFSTGADLANEADAGGNIVGNELERTQEFGRPMLAGEVCVSNEEDRQYVASNFARQSTYDRYLNIHDAQSLISRTAITVSGNMNGSLGRALVNFGQTVLQPLNSLGSLASMLTGISHAAANCNSNAATYGNVQFGWSSDEEQLIDSSDSYKPLENQQILDDSGKEDEIAKKYAVCFGYEYNPDSTGSLDPTETGGKLELATGIGESASIGTLLSQGYIIRDASGNVINAGSPSDPPKGLCSPQNLGYHTTDSLGADGESKLTQDLIFRWRLAMRYDTTADQQLNVQDVKST